MQLSKEEVNKRIEALKQELGDFGKQAQEQINDQQTQIQAAQQNLQNTVRGAQKTIDNLEGKIAGLVDLLAEIEKSEPKTDEPKKIIELPDQTKAPEGK